MFAPPFYWDCCFPSYCQLLGETSSPLMGHLVSAPTSPLGWELLEQETGLIHYQACSQHRASSQRGSREPLQNKGERAVLVWTCSLGISKNQGWMER